MTAMGCGPVTFLVRKAGLRGGFLAAISIQSACLLLATFLGQDAAGYARENEAMIHLTKG